MKHWGDDIEIFSKEYKADEAIRWYTKESFVYRLVNRAIRINDITLWDLSRYYIADMCKQMEIVYREQNCSKNFILYRGQRIYYWFDIQNNIYKTRFR